MNQWLRRMNAAMLFGIILCTLSFGILIVRYQSFVEVSKPITVNKARLLTSEILYLLENTTVDNIKNIESELSSLLQECQVELVYATTDGTVLYSSIDDKYAQKLNLKYDLHYELYQYEETKDFQIAFPVIDGDGRQIGNALFSIDKELLVDNDLETPLFPITILTVSVLFMTLILVANRYKYKKEVAFPLSLMKERMEAILKGSDPQLVLKPSKITSIQEFETVFEQMCKHITSLLEENEKALTTQKDLIANISHDIKTPLSTVRAYIDAILDGVCTDISAVKGYVEIMQRQTEKMSGLVNDLFMHALKQLGQITINKELQYSQEVFDEMNSLLKPLVEAKRIEWIQPEVIPNVLISVDVMRLEQVLTNLVNNATKHTPAGGWVKLDVVVEGDMLKVTVIDNGSGISPEDVPYIFDRFYQGHYQTDKKGEGAGLGLSICKYIIEAHGGQISFTTSQGEGTNFCFTIPIV